VRTGSRRAAEQTARLFELVGLPDLAVLFDETAVRVAPDAVALRDDLSRTLRKSYRYAEAAHQARVARVLGGEDVGDATSEEREAASRDAERALGDAALARLEAKDVEGARVRLERARAAGGLNTAAIGELLALVGEAKPLR